MTAAPCRDCGTTGGYVPRGYNRPTRIGGRCSKCYELERAPWHQAKRLAQFHALSREQRDVLNARKRELAREKRSTT